MSPRPTPLAVRPHVAVSGGGRRLEDLLSTGVWERSTGRPLVVRKTARNVCLAACPPVASHTHETLVVVTVAGTVAKVVAGPTHR